MASITAKQAKKLSGSAANLSNEKIIKKIDGEISKSISLGNFAASIDGGIPSAIRSYYESLGYVVSYFAGDPRENYADGGTTISWT